MKLLLPNSQFFIYYANRGFSVLFLTLEKAGLQVNLISGSEMYSIILYIFQFFSFFLPQEAVGY